MKYKKKHLLHAVHWKHGKQHHSENWYASFEDAVLAAEALMAESWKIFDETLELVFCGPDHDHDSPYT